MRPAAPILPRSSRPRRARRLVVGASTLGLAALGIVAVPSGASAASFTDEGSTHFFVVPAGVTSLTVDAVGGAGGSGPLLGGRAAEVQATLSVTPGQTVYVHVASNGSYQDGAGGATNGGGASPTAGSGGGATDIRVGTDDLAHRVLVAAGGGGTGNSKQGAPGDAGVAGEDGLATYCAPGGGGSSAAQPGTQLAGGAGGTGCTIYGAGTDGTLGSGGAGSFSAAQNGSGGGGGGGYYGGGGGNPYSGGAGGSSYVDPSATSVSTALAPWDSTPSVSFGPLVFGQSIAFTSTAPSSPVAGGSYLVTASNGGSSSPLTFSTSSTSCTVAPSGDHAATVHFTHLGDCTVAVDQAGDANYTAAAQQTQSMTVAQGPQTISYTSTAPSPSVGGSYDVAATGGESPNPVTYSTASPTCTVTDHGNSTATVSFVHVGDCTVKANQAGNADFTAAVQQTQSMTVGQGAQAVVFTSTNPVSAKVGALYLASATGGASAVPVVFSTTSTSCTVANHADGTATVKFTHVGPCAVAADQAGNADYAAAPKQTQTVNGVRTTQTMTFPALRRMRLHHANQALRATASSLLGVHYRTLTPRKCSVVRGKVHARRTGTCTIAAYQAGNSDYFPSATVKRSLRITR
ncbi:MAG: glycine rich domain-containing protein [Marmoricola sp.]